MYKSLGGSADEVEYRRRLKSFFLLTLMSALGYSAEICGLPPTATQDGKGYRFYASRSEAQRAFMESEQVDSMSTRASLTVWTGCTHTREKDGARSSRKSGQDG